MSTYTDLDAISGGGGSGSFSAGCDLSGSDSCQIVVGLQGNPINNATPNSGDVLTWNGSQWVPAAGPSGSFSAGGDLSGTSTNQTVERIQGYAVYDAAPSDGQVLQWSAGNSRWEATTPSTTGAAGGDLSGTYPNPTVAKINGTSVPATPSANEILVATSGTTAVWSPIYDGYIASAANIAVSKLAAGTAGQLLLNNSTPTPTWTTMSGDATISSAGAVTNAKINGASVPAAGSLTTGNVLQVSGTSSLTYGPVNLAGGSNYVTGTLPKTNQAAQDMAGDVTGTTAVSVVAKANGATIPAAGALTTGNVLQVSGSSALSYGAVNLGGGGNYVTGTLPAGNQAAQTMAGDVTGTTAVSVVEKINGATVPVAGSLTPYHVLQVGGVAATTYGFITNDNISALAAIVYSKLNLSNSIVNADINSSAAIAYSKLNLATSIVNADISASAAIAYSKLNLANSIVNADVSASAAIAYSKLNLSNSIVNADVSASAAIAYSKLNLSGSIVNADVSTSAAIAVSKLAAGTSAQFLLNNSTPEPTWTSMSGDISLTNAGATTLVSIRTKATASALSSIGAESDGYVLTWNNGSSEWQAVPPSGGSPTGAAGGDLSGTYPNPTVAKINGTTITTAGGALNTGAVLRVTGAASADWGALDLADTDAVTGVLPKTNQASQDMGGDVSGTTAASTVDKIKGKTLAASVGTVAAAQDGYVLTWDNGTSSWIPSPTASAVTFAGDLSGNETSQTVEKIKGTTITTAGGALNTGAVLRVTGAASADWGALDLADTDAVTGILPKGNQANQDVAGDVTGTTGATTVVKIRGKDLHSSLASIGVPEDGYVLTWDGDDGYWIALPSAGGGINTVGAIDTNSNANGLYISGSTISTQSASASVPGMVNTTTQSFAGNKTFTGTITAGSTTGINTLTGGIVWTTRSISGNLTIDTTTTDMIILVDTSSSRTITLPSPSNGRMFIIKDKTGGAETNNITLARNGSESIEGIAANRTLATNWGKWTVVSDGTNWFII